jgi:GNAT superfamily N-acetyltransferase
MMWHIRRMESRDLEAFLKFLGRRITYMQVEKHYHWLYEQNPHGHALTWLSIHKDTEKIIGCTSIFPRKMRMNGQTILGSVGGDTFVDPKFRRQGIAKGLHNVSLEDMRKNEINFHFGFPVPANLGAFIKGGAYYPGDFKSIRFISDAEIILNKIKLPQSLMRFFAKGIDPVLKLYIRGVLSRGKSHRGELRTVKHFDSKFDTLMQEITPLFEICGIRDSEYLNWRYFKNPLKAHTVISYEKNGELHGLAALEMRETKCVIFDFFARPTDLLVEDFICRIVEYGIHNGAKAVSTMINPSGPYVHCFKSCGFHAGLGVKKPLMVLTAHDDPYADELQKLSNWYLSYGDQDVEATYLR